MKIAPPVRTLQVLGTARLGVRYPRVGLRYALGSTHRSREIDVFCLFRLTLFGTAQTQHLICLRNIGRIAREYRRRIHLILFLPLEPGIRSGGSVLAAGSGKFQIEGGNRRRHKWPRLSRIPIDRTTAAMMATSVKSSPPRIVLTLAWNESSAR